MARTKTDFIAIHCSATRPIQDIGVKEIDKWHKAQGWTGCGYHFVIRRDGRVEKGRQVDAIGAHVAGYNARSVGVCMVGGIGEKTFQPENNFTKAQWASLKQVVGDLVKKYPNAKVQGHRDFPKVAKSCPCFDAIPWAKANGFPTA